MTSIGTNRMHENTSAIKPESRWTAALLSPMNYNRILLAKIFSRKFSPCAC